MIDGATERLDIMNPYLTDSDMLDRITAAAERSARVRIVVSQQSNNAFATAALRHRYRQLAEAGVEIWEYPGAVVHAKLIVADDRVQFGTLNLDAWALYRNFEVAMIVDSAAVAQLFEERVFAPAVDLSSIGTPPTSTRERALANFAHRIAYVL
jgi:cardiolipin synthase